jgi:hypothetical protein
MNRAYILSLILLCLFGTMVVMLSFENIPNFRIIASVLIFLGGLIFLVYQLRKNRNTKPEDSGSNFLPPILKHSRVLQVLFATVALAFIVSVLLVSILLIFLSSDQILSYIESYFFYQLAILVQCTS